MPPSTLHRSRVEDPETASGATRVVAPRRKGGASRPGGPRPLGLFWRRKRVPTGPRRRLPGPGLPMRSPCRPANPAPSPSCPWNFGCPVAPPVGTVIKVMTRLTRATPSTFWAQGSWWRDEACPLSSGPRGRGRHLNGEVDARRVAAVLRRAQARGAGAPGLRGPEGSGCGAAGAAGHAHLLPLLLGQRQSFLEAPPWVPPVAPWLRGLSVTGCSRGWQGSSLSPGLALCCPHSGS